MFVFKNVTWQTGSIKAIGYNGGSQVAQNQKYTAGAPAKIKLTAIVGPEGSCRADGNDIVMIDVEVVDANGNRCPTYEDRINFTCSGPGQFLGGYNSGKRWSTNKDNLTSGYCSMLNAVSTEYLCGVPGQREPLLSMLGRQWYFDSGSITINSTAFSVTNGLNHVWPQKYSLTLGAEPAPVQDIIPTPVPVTTPTPAPVSNAIITNLGYTGGHADMAQVVSGAANGMQVYIDNACTFSGLPSYLIGGDYIRAFLSDAKKVLPRININLTLPSTPISIN